MELKQKYIEEKIYEVDDYFLEALEEFELPVSLKIARFLEENSIEVENNSLVSHILGGLVVYAGKPITFALEVVKIELENMTLTDITPISMDEYLDLRNLNLYIKSNEICKNKQAQRNSQQRV
mgnify:CR=1 FL=1|jgi:hypothetical protein|tara:strand:- start:8662 stop:9030 length:369 start_codon:yes stop_codon:yes gene_type:complete